MWSNWKVFHPKASIGIYKSVFPGSKGFFFRALSVCCEKYVIYKEFRNSISGKTIFKPSRSRLEKYKKKVWKLTKSGPTFETMKKTNILVIMRLVLRKLEILSHWKKKLCSKNCWQPTDLTSLLLFNGTFFREEKPVLLCNL